MMRLGILAIGLVLIVFGAIQPAVGQVASAELVATSYPDVQAALDACAPNHCTLRVPTGVYNLSSTLHLDNTYGVHVIGSGATGQTDATIVRWTGQGGALPMLSLRNTRDTIIEGLTFQWSGGGMRPSVGIDIDGSSGSSIVTTHNTLRGVHVQGPLIGVRLAATWKQNVELMTFDDVTMDGPGRTVVGSVGLQILSLQSKGNRIFGSSFSGYERGIAINGGSFNAWGTNFEENAIDVSLNRPTDAISIEGCVSENAGRFLATNKDSNPWPVAIRSCRLDTSKADPAGDYIRYEYEGPLELDGDLISSGAQQNGVHIVANGLVAPARLTVSNSHLPNQSPFSGTNQCLEQFGNTYAPDPSLGQGARPLASSRSTCGDPMASAIPTPKATATSPPTSTSVPTMTTVPTDTPTPTEAPTLVATLVPTDTLVPIVIPTPVETPTPAT